MPDFPRRKLDDKRWKQGSVAPIERAPRVAPAAPTAWEAQASWYDGLQGAEGDDFHQILILPAVSRLLAVQANERVLDLACGNGVLGRHLAKSQVQCVGVDASPALITSAKRLASSLEQYRIADARQAGKHLAGEQFDHAACILAIQDLDPVKGVFDSAHALVKPGGRFVVVLTHPCFRIPKCSSWGWDEEQQAAYRRVDSYLSRREIPIRTRPGTPTDTTQTMSHHRPISAYINALGFTGWGIIGSEELCSHRRGSKGIRSVAEDRIHREIPVFLVLLAQRLG